MDVDAVIVGGGPCGMTLCKGLLDLGYSVAVIEKDPSNFSSQDWSKAYSFRVDVRGLSLLRRVGLYDKLLASDASIRSEGFKGFKWMPDGKFVTVPPRTLGSVAYWIVRPKFMQLLHSSVPDSHKIQGEVCDIDFEKDSVSVSVKVDATGTSDLKKVRAKFLFGCDGIRSLVRSKLCSFDPSFEITKVPCLSEGLVFRATLYTPPDSMDPNETYIIFGKTGSKLGMLPFGGEPGKPRPVSTVRQSDFSFFQLKSPEALYEELEAEFPQLDIRNRLSPEAAQAWVESDGSTFPRPRYAGRAGIAADGVVSFLVGDAMHCFPPDLGQGLNSGMVDVERVLDLMRDLRDAKDEAQKRSMVDALSQELVAEAQAVCQIVPIGMPYQYSFPFSLHKAWFFADFLSRMALHHLVPALISAPAIIEIQDDPPKKYTIIMQNHWNTSRRLAVLFGVGSTLIAGGIWSLLR
ncbi:FAD binding domain [Seminavis robusta]|uniref:FAD binding domain n=1 Tax=Seminavis robusta TaxID=568900 RepID=A0A9N8HS82_9STRA|nr:FAD binding domain [Seminavis robusta]|eukprot:Sro1142_g245840.1 FAD binding domain (462) ;mRNA; r:26604-27989